MPMNYIKVLHTLQVCPLCENRDFGWRLGAPKIA